MRAPAPRASATKYGDRSGTGSDGGSTSTSRRGGWLLPAAAVAVGALCLWKLLRTCSIRVDPRCVTVVFETRRRSIICTSADREKHRCDLPRVEHFSPLVYLSGLLIYRNTSLLIVPPSSFFGAFTLPRSVFEAPGETVDCAVEDVQMSDGAVDMVLTVRYVIPFAQLERYLAAVGPRPPNEVIGIALADLARVRCGGFSVGMLISKTRREHIFLEPFRSHLYSKLMSEAAIQVISADVENVELIEDS